MCIKRVNSEKMEEIGMLELKHCIPEEVGVSSLAVIRCLDDLEKHNIPVHSLMIIRHGKVAAEVYYEPCNKNKLHRFYSVTKSFTSIAIGCLIGEGRLTLNDSIVSYFPEYVPENASDWLSETTIKNMLEMQSCHSSTTYKRDWFKNWVESFFIVEPDRCPGTIFSYDTSSSHTLCALVEKLTGMKMLDYLRGKCLDEIGFSKEAYITEDPFGVSWGGSGLMMTTEDAARFAMLLLNEGRWNGRQLVPEWYIKEAVSCRVPNVIHGNEVDDVLGYGYQFWKLRKGFSCRGKGSQFIICVPEDDFICVTTADTTGIPGGGQKILDNIFEGIEATLDQFPVSEGQFQKACFENRRLSPLAQYPCNIPEKEDVDKISGIWWKISSSHGSFNRIKICLSDEQGEIICGTTEREYRICFGFGNLYNGNFPGYDRQEYVASGCWLKKNILYIEVRIIGEEPCFVRIQLTFKEEEAAIRMINTGELCFQEFSGWYEGRK